MPPPSRPPFPSSTRLRFLLSVGTIEPRKNHALLLRRLRPARGARCGPRHRRPPRAGWRTSSSRASTPIPPMASGSSGTQGSTMRRCWRCTRHALRLGASLPLRGLWAAGGRGAGQGMRHRLLRCGLAARGRRQVTRRSSRAATARRCSRSSTGSIASAAYQRPADIGAELPARPPGARPAARVRAALGDIASGARHDFACAAAADGVALGRIRPARSCAAIVRGQSRPSSTASWC